MAVAYQSDGGTVFAAANSNAAITVPLPATRPAGSVLLFVGFSRLITDTVGTAPSGYTLLTGFPKTSGTASGGRIWVYARVVDGTESAPTFACSSAATGTTGDLWGACIFCYSGVDTTDVSPIDDIFDGTATVNDASGTTTCTYPALSITNANSLVVRFLARFRDAADTFTFTATWNEREDAGSTTRTGAQLHLQDKRATASGSQATVTVAPSNTTAARYLAITLAFKAAVFARSATVDGTGGIASAGTFFTIFERQAVVAATGAVASAATFYSILERTAALAATGSIASVATFLSIFERSTALGATGSVAASGEVVAVTEEFEGTAALGAIATVATASQRELLRSATLGATGALATSAIFYSILERASALAASASLATVPERELLRQAALAASATLAASGQIEGAAQTHERAVAFGVSATLAVSGLVAELHQRSVAFDASAGLTVAGESEGPPVPEQERAASFTASATLNVSGSAAPPLPAGYIDFPTIGLITSPVGGLYAGRGHLGRIPGADQGALTKGVS